MHIGVAPKEQLAGRQAVLWRRKGEEDDGKLAFEAVKTTVETLDDEAPAEYKGVREWLTVFVVDDDREEGKEGERRMKHMYETERRRQVAAKKTPDVAKSLPYIHSGTHTNRFFSGGTT